MPFKLLAYNRLREGGEVAAQLPASQSDHRRWMAIYPVIDAGQKAFQAFRVLDFELQEDDVEDFFSASLRKNQKKLQMLSEQELYTFLEREGIEPSAFDAPWNCSFPSD
jgi:hypothetical protein